MATPHATQSTKESRDMMPLRICPESETSRSNAVYRNDLSANSRELLNHLRMIALSCRASARADLFEACAVLSSSKTVAKNAYAETLMKCLGQSLKQSPMLYRPGVEEVSFDEAWLIRAVEAAGREDWNSFEFLIRSRVPFAARRNLGSLIVSISEHFSLN